MAQTLIDEVKKLLHKHDVVAAVGIVADNHKLSSTTHTNLLVWFIK